MWSDCLGSGLFGGSRFEIGFAWVGPASGNDQPRPHSLARSSVGPVFWPWETKGGSSCPNASQRRPHICPKSLLTGPDPWLSSPVDIRRILRQRPPNATLWLNLARRTCAAFCWWERRATDGNCSPNLCSPSFSDLCESRVGRCHFCCDLANYSTVPLLANLHSCSDQTRRLV